MSVQITTSGFERLDARLAQMAPNTARTLRTAMQASLIEVEAGYRQNLSPFRLTGRSMNSVHSTIVGTGLALEGSVGSSAAWGRAFELGRPPGHWPPLAPLIQWVQRRGLGQTFSVRTHRRQGGTAASGRTFAIARAVQRKIARRGIVAHPALIPAFERALPRIRDRFRAARVRVVVDLAR